VYPYYQPCRMTHYFPPNNYVPYWQQPPYFLPYQPYRQLPAVNPSVFMTSAKHMQIIMKDASLLLAKMSSSRKFSFDLMTAAQNSNHGKVNQLLKGTGVQTMPKVSYTPDGLKLDFSSFAEDMDCCHLSLSLRWMK
jgi:hypothetical protein